MWVEDLFRIRIVVNQQYIENGIDERLPSRTSFNRRKIRYDRVRLS